MPEHAGSVLEHRGPVEQVRPAAAPGADQRLEDRPAGVLEVQREVVVVLAVAVVVHLREVGPHVLPDQPAHVLLGQRLLPARQRQRGREALQVPRVPAQVGLVEVVDVEDHPAVGVQVGAEVLDVQVAVHPDPAAVVVDVRVVGVGQVGVEETGTAPVERVRVRGHLAVLGPERHRVRLHQRREGVVEDGDDQLAALLVRHAVQSANPAPIRHSARGAVSAPPTASRASRGRGRRPGHPAARPRRGRRRSWPAGASAGWTWPGARTAAGRPPSP